MHIRSIVIAVCFVVVFSGCTTQQSEPTTESLIEQNTIEQNTIVPNPTVASTFPSQANAFYVLLEDGGVQGSLIGCNDSLIGVPVTLNTGLSSWDAVVQSIYQLQLVNTNQPNNAESFVGPTLVVQSVSVLSGVATIALSGSVSVGGVCDVPRIKEQLTAPALQFTGITQVAVTVNGIPLDTVLQ